MKKLLATTAMCLVLGTGLNSLVNPSESISSITHEARQIVEATLKQNALTIAVNMYRGDFQQVARAVLSTNMYSGDGAAQMGSVRMLRY